LKDGASCYAVMVVLTKKDFAHPDPKRALAAARRACELKQPSGCEAARQLCPSGKCD
jgi:hypothetical protein